mmetsp:Transcript_13346/g.42210  ORF Transcript_13346/g.42210 Transcript_13346/m.42210 type:complete len:240 (-) Transcript_13346:81-800(-)
MFDRSGLLALSASCRYAVSLGEWSGDWPWGCFAPADGRGPSACREACDRSVGCALWEYNASAGCRVARPCREAEQASQGGVAVEGHLVQHGAVVVRRSLAGEPYLAGLVGLRSPPGQSGDKEIERCRRLCYADVGCRAWQFGAGSCWLQPPPQGAASGCDSPGGGPALAGEQLRRTCPLNAHPGWLHLGVSAACLGACMFACAAVRGRGVTRERAAKRLRPDPPDRTLSSSDASEASGP